MGLQFNKFAYFGHYSFIQYPTNGLCYWFQLLQDFLQKCQIQIPQLHAYITMSLKLHNYMQLKEKYNMKSIQIMYVQAKNACMIIQRMIVRAIKECFSFHPKNVCMIKQSMPVWSNTNVSMVKPIHSLAHKTPICDFVKSYSAIGVQFLKGDIK